MEIQAGCGGPGNVLYNLTIHVPSLITQYTFLSLITHVSLVAHRCYTGVLTLAHVTSS